jgi:hypothetical protein
MYTIYLVETGEIIGHSTVPIPDYLNGLDKSVPEEYPKERYYIDSEGVPQLREDACTMEELALNRLKSILAREINLSRNEKEHEPILYDNKLLDADKKTITVNLPGKLKELEIRELLEQPCPVEELVWKDANNIIHSWTDQNTYKAWLQGLALAIAQRTTQLYGISWVKKAEIEALVTMTELEDYDVNAGW